MDADRSWRGGRIALAAFVVCALLFSWTLWLPLALRGPDEAAHSPLKYLHLFGSLGPALSAMLMARIYGGPDTLMRLLRRVVDWRVALVWHVWAWLSPFLVLIAAQAIANASGVDIQVGSLQRTTEYPELPIAVYWVAVLIFYGFGEEIGWRGFALPLLQTWLSPAVATLVLTVIWAVWHIPLFFFSTGMSNLGVAGTIGWLFSLLAGAFILTALLNGARGSILIAAGFHATMDIAFLGPPEVMMFVGAIVSFAGVFAFVRVVRNRGYVAILTRD